MNIYRETTIVGLQFTCFSNEDGNRKMKLEHYSHSDNDT